MTLTKHHAPTLIHIINNNNNNNTIAVVIAKHTATTIPPSTYSPLYPQILQPLAYLVLALQTLPPNPLSSPLSKPPPPNLPLKPSTFIPRPRPRPPEPPSITSLPSPPSPPSPYTPKSMPPPHYIPQPPIHPQTGQASINPLHLPQASSFAQYDYGCSDPFISDLVLEIGVVRGCSCFPISHRYMVLTEDGSS